MATRTRIEIEKRVRNAERRAAQKSARLEKKGVRTGSIDPSRGSRAVQNMSTQQLKSYLKKLDTYTNRSTQFVPGRDGTPLPKDTYNKFQRLTKEWNKTHSQYWKEWDERPFITAFGEEDMTVGMREAFAPTRYKRQAIPNLIGSEADLKNRIKVLQRELSPRYREERLRSLRRNLISISPYSTILDKDIERSIKSLTYNQLEFLANQTDFNSIYYLYIYSPPPGMSGEVPSITQDEQIARDHLKQLIRVAKVKNPRRRRS